MKTYAGYFYNWDEIGSVEGVNMLYTLVDGTFGLCLFKYDGWLTDFKQQLEMKWVNGLWEVDNLELSPTHYHDRTVINYFNKAALFFPEGEKEKWDYEVWVYADIVDEIIPKRQMTQEVSDMNTFQWTKNTVVPDLSSPMLHYSQYVDVQQQKDFEQTGSNVRRDREDYQKAYGSYCSRYRKMLEETNDTN